METTTYMEQRSDRMITNYVSWGAILAGVFVALSVATVLNLLGFGLDLLAFSPEKETLKDMTLLTFIWMVLTSIISMLAGGWVAGRMCGPALATEGALHGLVVCGVSIFLTFALVISLGSVIGLMSTTLAQSFSLAEQANAQNALFPEDQILQQELTDYFNAENQTDEDAARAQLNDFLIQTQGMNQAQADQTLNNLQNTKQNAIKNAKEASHALGVIVLVLFVSFLISAIASAFGGLWGAASERDVFVRKSVKVKKM